MELKQLSEEELTRLYNGEMVFDFPKAELKPVRSMLRLMEMGVYDSLLVREDGEAVGYAMVWLPADRSGGLLEYFGVLRGKRNGGIGGKILALLAERSSERRKRPTPTTQRRTTCAAAASLFISATASGCWTTSAPCSASTFFACTGARSRTTAKSSGCTAACTRVIFPRRTWHGTSSSPWARGRRSTPCPCGWRKRKRRYFHEHFGVRKLL